MTYIHTMVKMATAHPFQKVGFFFFKPFILYWNIADYNAIVVSGGFSRGSVVKNLPAYSHVWM